MNCHRVSLSKLAELLFVGSAVDPFVRLAGLGAHRIDHIGWAWISVGALWLGSPFPNSTPQYPPLEQPAAFRTAILFGFADDLVALCDLYGDHIC